MLERMQSKGNTPPLLVGMQTCTDTSEISVAVSQKIGNLSTSRLSNTTLGHIPKRCKFISLGHLLNCVQSRTLFVIARTQKQPRCPLTEQQIHKMWYIYTMEYYSARKYNDILQFGGKWIELEKIILSELTWTQIDKHDMF